MVDGGHHLLAAVESVMESAPVKRREGLSVAWVANLAAIDMVRLLAEEASLWMS